MTAAQAFLDRVHDLARIGSIQGHLGWDRETLMPRKGAAARSDVLAWLAAESHRRLVSESFGALLEAVQDEAEHDADLAATVREMTRRRDRAVLLPEAFVSEFARTRSLAQGAWQDARAASDFAAFAPHLETLLSMTKERVRLLGHEGPTYDALLDEYEIGSTMADYDPMFAELKAHLVPLLARITEATAARDVPTLPEGARFPVADQIAFCERVSRAMGFDFDAGRMDASAHPFSAGLWPGDTRFTTRFDEVDPFSCLYAVMHETGHALYEQGLPEAFQRTPRGEAISLGVHESQSRFWENQVGRTEAFWSVVGPWFHEAFPQIPVLDPATMNLIANKVEPGFIRVEADEVTYNLHIMIRYEIEKLMFEGDLSIADLPNVWNSMMREWFGLEVKEDRLGCLQDIHWSMGAFGYFPTYTLGNLYAAQLLEAMNDDLGDMDALIRGGDWSAPLAWLKARIHERGSLLLPPALIEEATGAPPTAAAFLRYIESKYSRLYGL